HEIDIPLGLIAAIPLVLSSKHVSYGQQAIFSFAHWPFSVKLLLGTNCGFSLLETYRSSEIVDGSMSVSYWHFYVFYCPTEFLNYG
ncbi:hypothetical protein WUBG_14875, partial [Wuchereria bancrofti]